MTVTHQELVEHLLGCSEDPQRIEAWLAQAPEAAEALERARAEVGLLASAARASAPPLDLAHTPMGASTSRAAGEATSSMNSRPISGRCVRERILW